MALDGLKLRQQKNIERRIRAGEIKYNHTKKGFFYVDDEDKEFEINKDANYDDEDDYDDEEDDDEEQAPKKKAEEEKKEEDTA